MQELILACGPLHSMREHRSMGELLQPGAVLVGKYRVDRILGEGGMGYVAACTHLQLQERVALKFLRPELAADQEAVARFLREAQAAARIRSEHIVRVHDVGTLENGTPYMVMEYLQGVDLAVMLSEVGRLPISDAVDFLLEATEALAQAHTMGIVHRDLKPANLFLAELPGGVRLVKVLDFGISKVDLAGAAPSRLTSTKAMLGTPYYMAPEQLASTRGVDARADIWALGVVLYELLSGELPFVGETLAEICVSVLQQSLRPIAALRPDVPPALDAVVARCLEKDREHRFAHVGDLAIALAPFGSARAASSVAVIGRILPPSLARERSVSDGTALPAADKIGEPTPVDPPGVSAPTKANDASDGGPFPHRRGTGAKPSDAISVSAMTGPMSWVRTHRLAHTHRVPVLMSLVALVLVVGAAALWWVYAAGSGASHADAEASSAHSPPTIVETSLPAAASDTAGSLAKPAPVSVASPPSAPANGGGSTEETPAAAAGATASAGFAEPPLSTASTATPTPRASGGASTAAPSTASSRRPLTVPPRPATAPKQPRRHGSLDPETLIDDRR